MWLTWFSAVLLAVDANAAAYDDRDWLPVAVPGDVHRTVSTVNSHELRLTVRAPQAAYVLFAHVATTGPATRFSDNYFDLEPGEERTISVSHPTGPLEPSDVRFSSR